MGATFRALFSNMPNGEPNVEECDAIGFYSSTESGLIIKFQTKYFIDY